jgi:transglutaminase-like putative cysteine protease
MKTFQIQHQTNYVYSDMVFLDFHTLHLRPISNACQQVTSFQLTFNPIPQGMTHFTDIEGNPTTFVWFSGTTHFLTVQTQMTINTTCPNPFDYLLNHDMNQIPPLYSPSQQLLLTPYLQPFSESESVKTFTHQLAKTVNYETIPFLNVLSEKIHTLFGYIIRDEGAPLQPDELLASKQGACRDFAYFFINSCRLLGLAARFVSGYQENPDVDDENHLHAWVEVYLPHAGWRGYDPSIGLAVSDGHIALAASVHADTAMPIIGAFRGQASSKMDYTIQIMHTAY